jgi:hypothetical protein
MRTDSTGLSRRAYIGMPEFMFGFLFHEAQKWERLGGEIPIVRSIRENCTE